MNPRAKNGVIDQNLVHDPLQQAGMTKSFAGVDWIGLATSVRYSFAASPAQARGTVPSHLPSSYEFAFTGRRSVTTAVSLKSEIETDGADAGSDALPVAQSCPRLST